MQCLLNLLKVKFGLYFDIHTFINNVVYLESYILSPNFPNDYPNNFDQVRERGNPDQKF